MQWEDDGLIVHAAKYSETSSIVTLFTARHGMVRSLAKGGLGKRQRGIFQPGNLVTARWNARLAEHLGNLQAELRLPVAALAMQDGRSLAALGAVCGLLHATMAERDPHPGLYRETESLLVALPERRADAAERYARFELRLLGEAGFGLDLDQCAASGRRDGLIYISPKSGRAVSADAGEPYKERLLPLPSFLRRAEPAEAPAATREILDALRVSGYFLYHWVMLPHGRHLPASRDRLMALLHESSHQDA